MQKQLSYLTALLCALLFFASCTKSSSTPAPSYASGQGKITGAGSASFTITGAASVFAKTVDTILVQANIDPSSNVSKQFIMGIAAKTPGTYNFVNAAANPTATFTSGAIAIYTYETVNGAGTVTAHEFATGSGTVVINSISATGVSGTYTANMSDINNNGDAPVTISGSFSGSF